jgi:hypothetical protein
MRKLESIAFCALLMCGCGPASPDQPQGAAPPSRPSESGRGQSAGTPQRERQAAFLNRIRQTDPQFAVVERAIFNDRNELGLILDRRVDLDSIPGLMKSLLTQMAREFPGEDLTILAYTPTDPPRRLGVARLDARTRSMTYTPDQPAKF